MQAMWSAKLPCQGQGLRSLRLRQEQQAQEIQLAVEDPSRRKKKVILANFY